MLFKSRSRKRKDCGLNCKIFIFWYQASSGIGTGRRFDHTIQRTFIWVNGL
ncbi:hypothetical protein ES288_A12G092700v1 [Gossypium darwinii]|uniref:Uncharacterized protein n=1 Tax=Gossypium darwinii TaxID=34276 RepID=A0A5D2E7B2_GOSDA|nr:hypothetical protein ES288_A12G092700v1 [Gossypium darwinii]